MNRMCAAGDPIVRHIDVVCCHAMMVEELLSIEKPKAVGATPLQPTLCARIQTGDVVVVPLLGLATVMFAAKADVTETPESTARRGRKSRRPANDF